MKVVRITYTTEQDENCIRRTYTEHIPLWYIQREYEGDIRPIRGKAIDLLNAKNDVQDNFILEHLLANSEKIPPKFFEDSVLIEIQIAEEVPRYKPLNTTK